MIHARDDYNRIQDPSNKIPEDEPVFLIRAQDITAPIVIQAWVDAQKSLPNPNQDIIKMAEDHIVKILEWQKHNVTKIADV